MQLMDLFARPVTGPFDAPRRGLAEGGADSGAFAQMLADDADAPISPDPAAPEEVGTGRAVAGGTLDADAAAMPSEPAEMTEGRPELRPRGSDPARAVQWPDVPQIVPEETRENRGGSVPPPGTVTNRREPGAYENGIGERHMSGPPAAMRSDAAIGAAQPGSTDGPAMGRAEYAERPVTGAHSVSRDSGINASGANAAMPRANHAPSPGASANLSATAERPVAAIGGSGRDPAAKLVPAGPSPVADPPAGGIDRDMIQGPTARAQDRHDPVSRATGWNGVLAPSSTPDASRKGSPASSIQGHAATGDLPIGTGRDSVSNTPNGRAADARIHDANGQTGATVGADRDRPAGQGARPARYLTRAAIDIRQTPQQPGLTPAVDGGGWRLWSPTEVRETPIQTAHPRSDAAARPAPVQAPPTIRETSPTRFSPAASQVAPPEQIAARASQATEGRVVPASLPLETREAVADIVTPVRTETSATTAPPGGKPRSPETGRAVIHQIAQALRTDNGTSELVLNPRELGQVRIHISSHEGGASVQVTADRPETMDLLRRHVDDLRREFLAMGYSDAGLGAHGQNRRGPSAPQVSEPGPPEPEADPGAPRIAAHRIGALRAGLDLRI